ncbi:haloacid dehalogenase-like hydrolase [Edaphobacter sp. HDX4]
MAAAVGVGLLLTGCEKAPHTKAIREAVSTDPLPSWNEGPTKKAIIDFVSQVTKEGGPNFVPEGDRIATFDNDGTLWVEQPNYTEAIFTLERVQQMAPDHPEWKTKQPFAAVLNHDAKAMAASGEKGLMQLLVVTHTGMTTEDFGKTVTAWIGVAQHPRFKRPYTQCIYQPMVEVLKYMRSNGFKTFIVSGGEQEFMRPWTDKTYGIPREQVVGSQIKTEFKEGMLMRLPQVDSIDDGPGKPVNIGRFIGKRPIAAFGNSDGDQQMLEYAAAGPGARLAVLVHHTDADREYAYDRESKIGRLAKALDEAKAKQWVVIDMKADWKNVFPAVAP